MDTPPKKEQPKFIDKIIDKVEEALLQPANPPTPQKQQQSQTQTQQPPSQKQQEEEVSEVALPKGTTITLPDGKSFETQTVSKLSKEERG